MDGVRFIRRRQKSTEDKINIAFYDKGMRYFAIYVIILICVLIAVPAYNQTKIEPFQSAYSTDYSIETDEDLQKLFSGMYTFLSKPNSGSTADAMNDCVRIRECAS